MRELQIQSRFDCPIKCHYTKNVDQLGNLLEEYKKSREDTVADTNSAAKNIYGQKETIFGSFQTTFWALVTNLTPLQVL